jgi:hypothetical protein
MNRYILIRRLRWPAILLLAGIIALLHEADLVNFWGLFLPLLLILIGVMKLAERAVLATADDIPPYPGTYPGQYPGTSYPYGGVANPPAAGAPQQPGASIVPAHTQDFGKDSEGGQS